MLNSILVAVNGTAPSAAAQALSLDLCRRLDAEIAGIAVLDRPWITAPQGGSDWRVPLQIRTRPCADPALRRRDRCPVEGVQGPVP